MLRQYRYIGSLDITIPRYNDLIPLLPWHVVIYRGSTVCMYSLNHTKNLAQVGRGRACLKVG